MKILVTGGRGLVGRPLSDLLAREHDVLATDLPEVDVTDPATVRETVRGFGPERVVHLAAWTDVDGCERDPEKAMAVNADGSRHVAAACASAHVPLLYVSTDYVFDGESSTPYVETDEPAPLSVYGLSKLEGERYVSAAGGTWTIVRCQSIYGRGRKSFADAILARARAGEPLRVVTDQTVSPTYADDIAAPLAALLAAAPGTYHLSNSGSCTWYEFARAVLDLSGFGDTAIEPITAAELGRPARRPANSIFSCERLHVATGLRLRGWRAALESYLASKQSEEGMGT